MNEIINKQEEAGNLADLLCQPHANLDSGGHLEPFDNCIACIRNERDELRNLLIRVSTDLAQSALEDPINFNRGSVFLSTPVIDEIGWRSTEYARVVLDPIEPKQVNGEPTE